MLLIIHNNLKRFSHWILDIRMLNIKRELDIISKISYYYSIILFFEFVKYNQDNLLPTNKDIRDDTVKKEDLSGKTEINMQHI